MINFLVKKIHGAEINIYEGFPESEAFCSKKPGRAGEPGWVGQVHKDPVNCHHLHGQEVEEVLQMLESS